MYAIRLPSTNIFYLFVAGFSLVCSPTYSIYTNYALHSDQTGPHLHPERCGQDISGIQEEMGGSVGEIYHVWKQYHERRDFYAETPGRGRKRLLTDSDHQFAARLIDQASVALLPTSNATISPMGLRPPERARPGTFGSRWVELQQIELHPYIVTTALLEMQCTPEPDRY
ncbi:hypothetical protein B0H11DRAFT_1915942 [Mycena galericulata]|nr:hypothetical protein B0H11DRAFT_1928698 [Mycena galericulata]KAJ7480541.1 hypothetical protein B0H11DRAFT_1915942 [Mycena galericulata]